MLGCNGQNGPDGKPVRIVPVDSCIIQNPKVWEASGHVAGFNDPMVDDKETKGRFRADHLVGLFEVGSVSDETSAVADKLNQPLDGRLPIATVIASGVGEAVAELVDNKKLAREIGLGGCVGRGENALGSSLLEVTLGAKGQSTGTVLCEAREIPLAMLDDHFERVPSPFTGKAGALTAPRAFNLMFDTIPGPIRNEDNKAYLRPETAQGIFINFKNVVDTTRVAVPFGIAQTGKAFRNEVTPRNFTFRSREFEQMEIEFFCHPDDAQDWYTFWRDWRMQWWQDLGLAGDNLIMREHDKDELAHYAKEGAGTADVEYRFPFTAPGYGEPRASPTGPTSTSSSTRPTPRRRWSTTIPPGASPSPTGSPRASGTCPTSSSPAPASTGACSRLICEAYTPDPDRASKVFMKFHPRTRRSRRPSSHSSRRTACPRRPTNCGGRWSPSSATSARSSSMRSSRSASGTPAWTRRAAPSASPSTATR